jgi:hypothetical protein
VRLILPLLVMSILLLLWLQTFLESLLLTILPLVLSTPPLLPVLLLVAALFTCANLCSLRLQLLSLVHDMYHVAVLTAMGNWSALMAH